MKIKLAILLLMVILLAGCTNHTKILYDANGCAYMFGLTTFSTSAPKVDGWRNAAITRLPYSDKPTCNSKDVKNVQNN